MVNIGDAVIFIDTSRVEHNALVTKVHGDSVGRMVTIDGKEIWWGPAINCLYVSNDEAKLDQYGRQIERSSSVVHEAGSTVNGYCYRVR